jgi:hypothetical protein
MKEFTITRIYADEQGESHFGQLAIPLEESGTIGFLSGAHPVETVIFRQVLPSYDYDFHTAPRRQYIVLLDGEIEIETSLGEKRQFKGGQVVLVEDTTGKGHKTRNLTPVMRSSLFIVLGL